MLFRRLKIRILRRLHGEYLLTIIVFILRLLPKYNSFVAGWLASLQDTLRSWKRKAGKITEQWRNNKKWVKIVAIWRDAEDLNLQPAD